MYPFGKLSPEKKEDIRTRRYIRQLTYGCTQHPCTNFYCASNPNAPKRSQKEILELAESLV